MPKAKKPVAKKKVEEVKPLQSYKCTCTYIESKSGKEKTLEYIDVESADYQEANIKLLNKCGELWVIIDHQALRLR